MNKKERTIQTRIAANIRWSNYRKHLVDEISKLTAKEELDFYLSLNPSSQSLREIWMKLLKRKNDRTRR